MTSPPRLSRPVQRAGGAFMFALGFGFVVYRWSTAHGLGEHAGRAEAIFPAFAVLGLALVAMPGYREERIARGEDISRLRGTALITPRWWIVLGIALAAAAANFTAFAVLHGG